MELNPMLDQLAHRIRREEHASRLARKAGMPEFGLGVDYIVTGEARMPGVADGGKDAVVAMFTINLPLWRKKYESAVVEAEERRQAAESSRLDRANELAAGLKMAHYRFRDAERKINLYGATLLPQARGAMNVARRNYETGEGQFLDLIDAQRVQLDFELEYQRALVSREQAVAEIELLVGGLPEHPASSPTGSAPSLNTP
jgi:outer membrane protein TolC